MKDRTKMVISRMNNEKKIERKRLWTEKEKGAETDTKGRLVIKRGRGKNER